MLIHVNTGEDARVANVDAVDKADLGVRYSSFRTLDRFEEQVGDIHFGSVSWPGGYIAEAHTDRYGLNFEGLFNPASGQPGLDDMIAFANAHDAGISIVLPTLRYAGNEALMRAEVRNFMSDLLGGQYGALPDHIILNIGSEYYHHFAGVFGREAAAEYGKVASAMVNEINISLKNPTLNPGKVAVQVGVQAGRSLDQDEDIRGAFSQDDLASVDTVLHHRYPGFAEGIDYTLKQFQPIHQAWIDDVTAAGGDRPDLNLAEWGVATVTREEALTKYIRDMRAEGITVHRNEVDLDGRTNDDFEQYWQELLGTRDYGIEQPRLYLELFSEYQAEGMGAASLHSWDMIHAGRDSFVDDQGNAVQFVGADMIDMIYESVEGLTVMDISTQNSRNSDLWTYGFENDDRLVLFLAADDDARVGEVTLDIEGLGGNYSAIWVESLTSRVPADWRDRFDIPDNPRVDESNEANTYALGVRDDLAFKISRDSITFKVNTPGEVVRIVVAQTPQEAAEVAEWAGAPHLIDAGGAATGGEVPPGSTGANPPPDANDGETGETAPNGPDDEDSAFQSLWRGAGLRASTTFGTTQPPSSAVPSDSSPAPSAPSGGTQGGWPTPNPIPRAPAAETVQSGSSSDTGQEAVHDYSSRFGGEQFRAFERSSSETSAPAQAGQNATPTGSQVPVFAQGPEDLDEEALFNQDIAEEDHVTTDDDAEAPAAAPGGIRELLSDASQFSDAVASAGTAGLLAVIAGYFF